MSSYYVLSDAAIAFDAEKGKTDFPHHEVKSKEDLEKVFDRWKSIYVIADARIGKQQMIITAQHFIEYEEHEDSRKIIEWAKEYCMNDVVTQSLTLAGLSLNYFKHTLGIELFHPEKPDDIEECDKAYPVCETDFMIIENYMIDLWGTN